MMRKFIKSIMKYGKYDINDIYLVAKLKIFNKINRTTFTNNAIPIENDHYICIPVIDIDSVLKIEKKSISSSLFRAV